MQGRLHSATQQQKMFKITNILQFHHQLGASTLKFNVHYTCLEKQWLLKHELKVPFDYLVNINKMIECLNFYF